MNKSENPFTIYGYSGPKYFCDRATELSNLLEMFDNQRFGLLYSMRRLGKTGMIHHLHHSLQKRKDVITVYCDVQNTRSDAEFVSKMITAVFNAIESSKKGITRRIGDFFSSLRPVLSFDPVTQIPSIELHIQTPQEAQNSLQILLKMLAGLPQTVQIALDEFQQIASYENSMIDATLRGSLDQIPNVHFLFCGSQRHLLLGLFTNAQRPFFGAVEQMQLQFLDKQIYHEFIHGHFIESGQHVSDEAVDAILTWTRGHTFYTQYFCNKLYASRHQSVTMQEVRQVEKEILYSFEPGYLSLQSVLSKNQFKLLKSIAHEQTVTSVSSKDFLSRYHIAQSTAQQSMKVLLDKELLYEELSSDGSTMFVYDPFFSRWLQSLPGN